MAGLAQKGGAVWIHLRLANDPADIAAIRVGLGEAHAVIGGDLVVTGGAKTLGLMRTGQTGAAVNSHENHHGRLHPRYGISYSGQGSGGRSSGKASGSAGAVRRDEN